MGFIVLLIWAFGGSVNPSKANWAKAMLLWLVAGFVLVVGFYVLLFAALLSMGMAS